LLITFARIKTKKGKRGILYGNRNADGWRTCLEMKFYDTRHYWRENEGQSISW